MSLLHAFAGLPDPRVSRRRKHRLCDVLFIALCASLCGADTFVAMERWAKAKQPWLCERLGLEGGVPSHDTFGRVFARLNPDAFSACFAQWTQVVHQKTNGEIIALDGKELRHSFDTATGQAALHLVSALSRLREIGRVPTV